MLPKIQTLLLLEWTECLNLGVIGLLEQYNTLSFTREDMRRQKGQSRNIVLAYLPLMAIGVYSLRKRWTMFCAPGSVTLRVKKVMPHRGNVLVEGLGDFH